MKFIQGGSERSRQRRMQERCGGCICTLYPTVNARGAVDARGERGHWYSLHHLVVLHYLVRTSHVMVNKMIFLIRRHTEAHFLKKHFRDINMCNSICFCRVALTKVCHCVLMCSSSFYLRVPRQHFYMAMWMCPAIVSFKQGIFGKLTVNLRIHITIVNS
uniref:Uncharacterized protein n=1 Tax=Solanum lycopersicum TaxID=4081 RepID=K4BJJ4_SOLLC